MDENEQKAQEIEKQIQAVNQQVSTLKEKMRQVKNLKERQPMNEELKQLRTQRELLVREQAKYCKLVEAKVALGVAALQDAKASNNQDELKRLAESVARE